MLTLIAIVLTAVLLYVWYQIEIWIGYAGALFGGIMNLLTHHASFRAEPLTFGDILRWIARIVIVMLPRAMMVAIIVGIWWLCT